jgi:hypothetical protein
VGFWSNRGGTYPYEHIWILTMKGIYAEGLQQGRRKKRIGMSHLEREGKTVFLCISRQLEAEVTQ